MLVIAASLLFNSYSNRKKPVSAETELVPD